jgi:N-acetylmuramoyl-L-alanine amidase
MLRPTRLTRTGAMQEFAPDSRFVHGVRPSPNHDARASAAIDILLLHYTGMASTAGAIERLCEPAAKVSSHYVIDEAGEVFQLVAEARRGWHAGVSSWEGTTDINSRAIGIEIANPGHDFGYPDFPEAQIEAVIALCRDIVARHRIGPDRVLAHSDVAPLRKRDPGEKFPWKRLHQAGVGAWTEPVPVTQEAGRGGRGRGARGAEITEVQGALKRYGYGIEPTGVYDEVTEAVVTAFQRHFRPARIDGVADLSTIATLHALLAARERGPARSL